MFLTHNSVEISFESFFPYQASARARDPEGGPVRYSLTSGNDLGHFSVEESTGVVRVAAEAEGGGPGLDREQQRRYSLAVRAEDQGGKVRGFNLKCIQ